MDRAEPGVEVQVSLTGWLSIALTLGCFSVVMSATTINVAITPMMQSLEIGPQVAQLFSSVFLGLTVVVAPISAWFADKFGAWRVFLGVLVFYVAASLAGLLVDSFSLLLVIRICQGFCAGVIQPLSMFLLLECTPQDRRGRALSLFGLGVVMAPAMGPAIAGWVVDHAGWQSVFVLGAPPALLAIAVAWMGLDRSQISAPRQQLRSFDWFGVTALAMLVMVVFVWPFVLERSVWLGGVCALAWLAACRAFWLSQQRRAHSILPTALFALPAFRRAALITFVYGIGMYGSIFLIPLLLQDGLGVSAAMTGNLLLIGGIALAVSISAAGRLVDRYSPKHILTAGMVSFTLSCVLFSVSANLVVLTAAIAISRIGLGSIIPSLYAAMAQSVEGEQLRQATSMTTFLRQGGGALGIVAIGVALSLLTSLMGGHVEAGIAHYSGLFMILAVLFASGALMARRM